MEPKQIEVATLDKIQKKVDKMHFMLTLVVCSLVIICFFVTMLIIQLDTRELVRQVKDNQINIENTQEDIKILIESLIENI